MMNQSVAERNPLALKQLLHKIVFNFHGILLLRQAQPLRKPRDVGIDHHAGSNFIGRAQHHIGRFAPHAGKLDEFFQRLRNGAVVFFDKFSAAFLNALGLVAEEAGTLNCLFQCAAVGFGKRRRIAVFFEQCGGHHIHAYVGTLGRKNS